MKAFGATLIEHGETFDDAKAEAAARAAQYGLYMVPAYHGELVRGVASYGLELLEAVPDLDTVYVLVGCGSGLCGTIAAKEALGHPAKIVGVVSAHVEAPGAASRRAADRHRHRAYLRRGVAVCTPVQAALDYFGTRAERFVAVTDDEVAQAVRVLWQDTHNLAEGAGAVAMAALLQNRPRWRAGRWRSSSRGGNCDQAQAALILSGRRRMREWKTRR